MKLFYIPALVGTTIFISYFLAVNIHIQASYLPTLIFMFCLLGFLDAISTISHYPLSKKDLKRDLFFIILNPILVPVLYFVPLTLLTNLKISISNYPEKIPFILQVIIVFLVVEFFRYWIHRLQHEIPFLWKFHAVHHSMKKLYAFNQYISHPIDYFLRNVLSFTPVFIFNFDPLAIIVSRAINISITMNSHVESSQNHGFWNYIFPTYDIHKWHHSIEPSESNNNYGVSTCLWDHVFNSFYWPKNKEVSTQGIHDVDYNPNCIKSLMVTPFKK